MFRVSATSPPHLLLFTQLTWDHMHLLQFLEQVPVYASKPEGILSAADLQHTPLFTHTDRAAQPEEAPSQIVSAENLTRCFVNIITSMPFICLYQSRYNHCCHCLL